MLRFLLLDYTDMLTKLENFLLSMRDRRGDSWSTPAHLTIKISQLKLCNPGFVVENYRTQ